MQYDVLDMPNRSWRGPIHYPTTRPQTILSEETDEETGDTVIRRTPAPSWMPDSHYVICRNEHELEPWKIYAGPFSEEIAVEISEALQANGK